jgi:hypothetical protein
MAEECGQSLQEFFALRRASQRGGTGS